MHVRIFPRRKKTTGEIPTKGRLPLHVHMADLQALLHLSVNDAAKRIGISSTALKKISRKLGILRWPYQREDYSLSTSALSNGDDLAWLAVDLRDNEPYCREGGPRAVPLSQPHAATASCEEMPCVESSHLEICGEHERDPFLFLFTSI